MAKQLLTPIRRQAPWHPVVGLGGHTLNATESFDDDPHIQEGIGELLLDKL